MKTSRATRVLCWALLVISGGAGLGVASLISADRDPLTSTLLGAAFQLFPLVGLMLIAAQIEQNNHHDS